MFGLTLLQIADRELIEGPHNVEALNKFLLTTSSRQHP